MITRALRLKRGEERLGANRGAQLLGIVEQPTCRVQDRRWGVRAQDLDLVEVLREQGGLDGVAVQEVERQPHDVLSVEVAMFGQDRLQLLLVADGRVTGQDGVQHSHEMALARAEGPFQEGGSVVAAALGVGNQGQRLVEGLDQLRGEHIVGDGLGHVVGGDR